MRINQSKINKEKKREINESTLLESSNIVKYEIKVVL